ncbi:hypothetical protein HED55_00380 [Ochrobactrum haematophilum]|uniref:Uncharacterized protein n=1 Tax=Brucella haematophila TaxID=419474 RepID=A0ABX1DHJ3_9HYPH|nr:hypothetical protein [Brucella haematophila]
MGGRPPFDIHRTYGRRLCWLNLLEQFPGATNGAIPNTGCHLHHFIIVRLLGVRSQRRRLVTPRNAFIDLNAFRECVLCVLVGLRQRSAGVVNLRGHMKFIAWHVCAPGKKGKSAKRTLIFLYKVKPAVEDF